MIRLETVSKHFENPGSEPVVAVNEVSFEVPAGETLCLIGTSGSGKTTCMKMINRLLEPTGGRIFVGDQEVRALDPIRLRRSIGYVIQKGGLLPHFTVAQNIGILCKLEKWDPRKTLDRVKELLALVNMEPDQYMARYPSELSGGQRQRVGVARALALDPAFILMDEPFGALDPITREGIHDEFIRLKHEVKKTIVIVTHDLAEAFKLGDRVALMDGGRLIQHGTTDDFLHRPANEFVAEFVRSHSDAPPLVREALDAAAESNSDAPTIEESATVRTALELLLKDHQGVLRVVDEQGNQVGMVSRDSLLEALK